MIEFLENFNWLRLEDLSGEAVGKRLRQYRPGYRSHSYSSAVDYGYPRNILIQEADTIGKKFLRLSVVLGPDIFFPPLEVPQKKIGISTIMSVDAGCGHASTPRHLFRFYKPGEPSTSMPYVQFRFASGTTILFTITMRYSGSVVRFEFSNGTDSEIEPISAYWFIHGRSQHHLSMWVDGDGAQNSEGSLSIALDGRVIGTRENIVTMNYPLWKGDPFSSLAYFESVGIYGTRWRWEYWEYEFIDAEARFSDFCIFSGRAGYHDDHFGITEITSHYPDPTQDAFEQNASPYLEGTAVTGEDRLTYPNGVLVTAEDGLNVNYDENYVEASEADVGDTYFFETPLPRWFDQLADVHAVRFMIWGKKIFDYEQDYSWSVATTIVPSGGDLIENTITKTRIDNYSYQEIGYTYDLNPYGTIPWTWSSIQETAFGFRLAENIQHCFLEDHTILIDSETNE
jgi:hypothetical protein